MIIKVCQWVGINHEGCRRPTIVGKSYCEEHQDRVYTKFPTEMADYIFERELLTSFDIVESAK